MGMFIDGNLRDGEVVVSTAKVHWATLIVPAIFTFFSAGILLPWLIVRLIQMATTEVAVTTQRFIHKSGFIARRVDEVPLDQISGVNVDQGIIDLIFGAGTVVVNGGGAAQRPTPKLASAVFFRNRLTQEITTCKGKLFSGRAAV